MDCSQNISGTLRARGHTPLVSVYENHGIDARYNGPLSTAPTMSARYGTGGNNIPLVEQESSRVFVRKRTDEFRIGRPFGTQSARQYKDATDLIAGHSGDSSQPMLIRRLTELECERLQGYPDGWTDLPGASVSARYRALGNSIAVPCGEYVLRGIAAALIEDALETWEKEDEANSSQEEKF